MAFQFDGNLQIKLPTMLGEFLGEGLFGGDLRIESPIIEGKYGVTNSFAGDLAVDLPGWEALFVVEGKFNGELEIPLVYLFGGFRAVPAEVFKAYVMNLRNLSVCEYDNFGFNSVMVINGKAYGANSSGLYLLEGADDAGTDIQAEARSGITDFASSKYKRINSAGISCRSKGGLSLTTVTDEEIIREYQTEARGKKGVHYRRVLNMGKGKGVKAGDWELGIKNKDGADFEVFAVESEPVELLRRAH